MLAGCDFGVLDDPCLLLDQTRRGRVTCTPGPMGYFCGRNNAFLAACVVVDDRSCFRRGTAAGRVVATGRVAKYCVACWRQRQVCCTTKLPVGLGVQGATAQMAMFLRINLALFARQLVRSPVFKGPVRRRPPFTPPRSGRL